MLCMDGFIGKRTALVPRKASGLVRHENMKKKDDKNVPICSRIGCSARVSSTKGGQIGFADKKEKSSGSLFRSPSNGKEIVGSSSRSVGGFGYTKKASTITCRKQLSSLLDTDSSESSSVHDESATKEHSLPRGKTKRSTISVHSENTVSGRVAKEAGSSSRGNSRSIHRRSDLVSQDLGTGLSVSLPSDNSRQNARTSLNKHGLTDFRGKSGPNVLPPNSNLTRKSNIFRKKTYDGESSSSSRSNETDESVSGDKNRSTPNENGIPTSDSRRKRNLPTIRDHSVVSSVTRRSAGYYGRTGRPGAVASPIASLQAPQPATQADLNPYTSAEVSNSPSNSYSRPISSNCRIRSMIPRSPSETSVSRSLINRDGFRRYDMNGVAEVLLALERIEQDEELTYEQLAVLETNLFLSGVSNVFHDQHRDMRLDIDNMSYEELLALEEKMGTVSTALSEEALLKSLKTSIYQTTDQTHTNFLYKDNDVQCSICQEEYVGGDEVGTLPCQHMYHVSCAQQWLRMKNWCPICKTCAECEPQPFS